jgi:hypothetical protein
VRKLRLLVECFHHLRFPRHGLAPAFLPVSAL